MVNDVRFASLVEVRLPQRMREELELVKANGFRIGIRNPVFFLRNPTFWYNVEALRGVTPDVWVSRVISHESLHAIIENVDGRVASLYLDLICNRGGWRYEDSGIPDEYADEYIHLGMVGLGWQYYQTA